jgi:hypothetical protein
MTLGPSTSSRMMRWRLSIYLISAWLLTAASPAWADAPGPSEPAPSVAIENLPESLPTGPYGEILFFPGETRPVDERHKVSAGQQINLCIRLSPDASSFTERLREDAMGLQLIMEDSAVPPHRMTIVVGNRLFRLKPNGDACYGGDWTIPTTTAPGVYQVADLFWATTGQSYYSLRRYLYEFSRVEELDVQNPKVDQEPPKLLSIRVYKKPPQIMSYDAGVLKIKLEQAFELTDGGSGIDSKTLRVTYRLAVGENRTNLEDAQCKRIQQTHRYRCVLTLAAPDFFWSANPVSLSLESLSVKDKAGNRLWIQGEEGFRAVAPKADLVFEFQRKKKWKNRHDRDLQREAPLPAEGLGAEPAIAESLPQSG